MKDGTPRKQGNKNKMENYIIVLAMYLMAMLLSRIMFEINNKE